MIAERWKTLLARYDVLTQRERALVAAALLGGIILVGNAFFIDLPLAKAKSVARQWQGEQAELQALQAQMIGLQSKLRHPDADNRQRLEAMDRELVTLRAALGQHQKALVSPEDVGLLLENLLARHPGLRLLALQTLPAKPVNASPVEAPESDKVVANTVSKAPADASRAEPVVPVSLWVHTIELRVQGSYAELADYLAALEAVPQRLNFGPITLQAAYPRSELAITLFTYSLDPSWIKL